MVSVGITEAKANLAKFVELARRGETVTITVGQSKIPVARLLPIKPVKKKRLGAMYDPNFVMGEAFWEPLPEGELRLWNCEGEGDLLAAEMSSVQQPK
jgi:prevent-host-death family protein